MCCPDVGGDGLGTVEGIEPGSKAADWEVSGRLRRALIEASRGLVGGEVCPL